MKSPFFSVVIPTKNRPELLRDATSSVLLQSFDDYELIVSDNFSDERTSRIVREFRNDKHLRYFRTDKEMNMPDHWEFATQKARGNYVLILTDRSFLRQNSLRDIHQSITGSGKDVSVCFWNYGYYDEERKVLITENDEPGTNFLKSEELARKFSQTLNARFLPRPHTGCYRFDIAKKIRQDVGRLCYPVAPDYTSSLLLLAYSDFVMYIPRPLFFHQGAAVSNANQTGFNPSLYVLSVSSQNRYQFVPIKAPISSSIILNDFLTIQNLAGGHLKGIEIDWPFYFAVCYLELKGNLARKEANKKVQLELLKEWQNVFSRLDEKMKSAVRREIRRRWLIIPKSYLGESFLGEFLLRLKRFLLGKMTLKFKTALTAGGFAV